MTERPKITAEMIRLYDEYTHVTLDRRGFMDRLAKLAGGTAAAAAVVPLLAANPASAALLAPDDPRVETSRVTFPGAGGELAGYLAKPAGRDGKLPAVLVIHENRGLNAHIEDVTRRMALEGFVALGLDFLSPIGGTPDDEDRAREMFGQLDRVAAVEAGIAAVEWLKNEPDANGKVGAIGFCWGGGMVNQIAVHSADLDAGVAYYGAQPDPRDVASIKAALLLHYGGLDERINAGIPAFEAALREAGVDHTIHIYEGANHAFNNDTAAARYDKAAADLAWSRTVEFLKAHLA